MKFKFTLAALCFMVQALCAATTSRPTIDSIVDMEEMMITTIKQGLDLRNAALSVTLLDQKSIEKRDIKSIKDASALAPNFYMPDYGSRITSSIYVRGLGARIDQSVVGVNIDNVPYVNKNAFDTDVMDIERIEILRGPQSTLYGRNTMGGVINIYTISPFNYQGLRTKLTYGTANTFNGSMGYYHKFSNRLAASLGGYYNSTDGYFTNSYTGAKCDVEQTFGGRLRLQWLPTSHTRIDNTLSMSHVDQGGYAYKRVANDSIAYNDPSSYRRTLINNGLSVIHTTDRFSLASITSYQYLDDCMTLDQDFTPVSMFTLQQAIQEHSITEDLLFKTRNTGDGFNWMAGLFGLYNHKQMQAPVRFKEQGIKDLILDNATQSDTYYYVWDSDTFVLSSDFTSRTIGASHYQDLNYTHGRWQASIGARLDYESIRLHYHSYTNTGCKKYDAAGNLTFVKPININLKDVVGQSFLEFLPKANVNYKMGARRQSSLYATVAKGYKSGGYNSQMFSDILQQEVMGLFGVSALYTAEEIITYKPEYSWNYEVGGHFESADRTLAADLSAFYIACHDQQLTIFPPGMVTGRMMTNAGESRSMGVEAAMRAEFGALNLQTSYGYTNAKFTRYNDNRNDYAGNYIPYSPTHTFTLSGEYVFDTSGELIRHISIAANINNTGRIYWNEANTLSQPFNTVVGSELRLSGDGYSLTLWGRNLTNSVYNTFYFMSVGNEFVQQGRPRSAGVTLNINM